jgi:hypothetical protein
MSNLGYSNSYDDSGSYDMYEPEDFSQHIAVGVGILSFFIAAAVSPLVGVGVALYAVHRYIDKDKLNEDRHNRDRLLEQQHQMYLSHWRGVLEAVPDGEDPPVPRGLSWQDGSMAEYLHLWEEVKGDRRAGKATIPAQLTAKAPAHPDDILPAEFVESLVNRRSEETGLKGFSVPVSLPDVPQAPKVEPIALAVNSLKDERQAFKTWIQQWADELLESTAEYTRCNFPKTRNYWARSNMKTVEDFDALMRRILAPNNVVADNWLYLSGKPPIAEVVKDAHIAVSESPRNSDPLEDRLIAFLRGKQNVTLPEIKAAIGEEAMGFLLTLRDGGRLTINKETKTVTLNG